MEQLEGMCYQWIVFTGVFYCLDDFNLSAEEVSSPLKMMVTSQIQSLVF